MATLPDDIPTEAVGLPQENELAMSPADAARLAAQVCDAHKAGRQRKRLRDREAEKFMLYIDGEQYVDVMKNGQIGEVPNPDGSFRAKSNLLRPITENFVSFHTSIPYSVIAEAKSDRLSRDKARVDTLWANSFIKTQKLNELVAECLFFAAPYGHCALHATWRDDISADIYEPMWNPGYGQMRPGFIDAWVGDPWSQVYNQNAARRSLQWSSYERIFPLDVVKKAFPNAPDIDKLRGAKDLPSSSRFQQTVRSWVPNSSRSGGLQSAGRNGDELVVLICREDAPGLDEQYPRGRLRIIALSGVAETGDGMWGNPMLLHDGPLPGARFSFVRFYALNRFDDIYGKAFVSDLADRQILRNQLESDLVEGYIRAGRPMLAVGPSGMDDDTAAFIRDGIIENSNPHFTPGYLTYPTNWMQEIRQHIDKVEQDMFRIGAWQAASRGEGAASQPAAALVAQARADDSILGPANRGIQGSVVEFLQLAHALTKEHAGPFPIPIEVSGKDYGYMAKAYITAEEMSDVPPNFTVTSAGGTPEARMQQLLNLVTVKGADGIPLLTTKQLRKQSPDSSIWPIETDIEEVKERRVQARNYQLREMCDAFKQQNGWTDDVPPEWVDQAAMMIAAQFQNADRIERTDDPLMHINGLSELVQDPNEDLLLRRAASHMVDVFMGWMSQMAPQGAPVSDAAPGRAQQPGAPAYSTDQGGTSTSDSYTPERTRSEVASLTREAAGGR